MLYADCGAEKLQQVIGEFSFPDFYVNAVDDLIQTLDENPTIGLLICKDKSQTEVKWVVQGFHFCYVVQGKPDGIDSIRESVLENNPEFTSRKREKGRESGSASVFS